MHRGPSHPLAAALPLLLAAVLAGCGAPEAPEALPMAALRSEWVALTESRNALFRSEQSPLPAADRAAFEGLRYFPYDTSLVFAVALEPDLAGDTTYLSTTVGPPRPYVRYGQFAFGVDGRTHRLGVYKAAYPTPVSPLFVPFLDATSGRESYAAGRYLEFRETADGRYVLDFNHAYQPYCAYDTRFSCPLPPEENRLPFAVRAGEQYHGGR